MLCLWDNSTDAKQFSFASLIGIFRKQLKFIIRISLLILGPDVCLDVVIFGAGLAGTLTAWKLRHHNYSMVLYQTSDEIESQFKTKTVQVRNLKYILEVGIPWLSSVSDEFGDILKEHGLKVVTPDQSDISNVKYNLRGKYLSIMDDISNLYHINDTTSYFDPVGTLKNVLEEWLRNIPEERQTMAFSVERATVGEMYELNASLKEGMMNSSRSFQLRDYTR